MLKILIIDDERDAINILTEDIESALENVQIEGCDNFRDAKKKIEKLEPDMVVLDLYRGAPGQDAPGLDVHEFIWESRFCPIVVFSANPSDFKMKHDSHPFVRIVEKGALGGTQEVRCGQRRGY